MTDQEPGSAQERWALSRRELLKALAASSGALAAAAFLPDKWLKPRVGVGYLPAHAQATLDCVQSFSIRYVLYLGNNSWIANARWTPAWPTLPQITVIMGGAAVTNPVLTFSSPNGPYYEVYAVFSYPSGGIGYQAAVEACFFGNGEPCCPSETFDAQPPS